MRTNLHIAAFASLAITAAASAQDLGIKAPAQSQTIAIVNGTVHPVSGPAIEGGHIVFDNGLITDVGPGPYTLTGPGTVIDATGKHVYPGLIGANTQMGLTELAAVRATLDFREVGSITPEVRAAVAVNPDSTLLPVTRSNGVLVVGVFPSGGVIPGRASVIRMDGWTWESMAAKADAGVVVNWPNVRPVTAWWMDQSEEEQLKTIQRNLDAIDEAFNAAEAYAKARAADTASASDLRWEAMRGVLPGGKTQLPVFISAQDMDQIGAAVSWAAKRKLKAVIVGGRNAPLCAELLKKHDVPVIIDGVHNYPKRDDGNYDDAYTLPARLQAAGVRWCLASGEETAHERSLPHHAGMAVAFGLDVDSAVRGVTLSAAEVLGVADTLGSLDTGKSATLIVTDGNPLEVTTKVERAFIDGRAIELSNKQTKLAEKYREKYRQKR